ncbi:HAMP domain-containing sensor histidine kinase [Romboutsia sp.]|uniref:sensor histidine kinase n=1 Tax=Romboutsia sp. TaxID=1965302 RepID=UPI002CC0B181|nr:HAMP domain-containing sensor histidine kinase [Romboutsia sp.]HSQ88368.1 HAMP domain-containing sensor histidine kinase [Romboutsia sp.]
MIDILNAINDYILVINKDGLIKFCNQTLLTKLKYNNNELDNININTILFNKNFDFMKNVNTNKKSDIELILYNRDKEKVLLTSNIISNTFNCEKSIFIISKNIEEVSHIESIKNEFFTNISHEFKTPLNIILGTMQLLERNIIEDNIISKNEIDLERYTKCIKQNSYRLLRLANNLIDISRIETGYYELQLGNHDIINIIEEITLSVSSYMEEKGINLIFDTDSEETILACDPDKIERIVLNLLSNAIKYTDHGGKINVYMKVIDSKVIVSIKDSGSGISKEKLPYIFERYVQDDSQYSKRCEGSGIGLSLVKSLVEMHGGSIYAKSELGVGSEFIFEIPTKLVEVNDIEYVKKDKEHLRIEKCNVEFSDVYSV